MAAGHFPGQEAGLLGVPRRLLDVLVRVWKAGDQTGSPTAGGTFVGAGKIPGKEAGARGFHSIVATDAIGERARAKFELT